MKDPLWEHTSIGAMGAVCRELGRLDQAVECFERSLRHCQQIGDNPSGESAALNNLGLTYSDQGRLADAIDCLQQSLTICVKTQNRFGEAVVISNLGEAHYRAGRLDIAIEFYERSLLIHREIGDRCREAETLWRLGWVQDALDQQAQAHACWNAAQAIFKELGVTPPTQQEFQRTVWW
jgi:tetratricopeptide (TPR) repeat protein